MKTEGNFGWIMMLLRIRHRDADLEIIRKIRFTGVLVKAEGLWKYSQTHWSVSELGLERGRGKPTRKGLKEKINELMIELRLEEYSNTVTAEIREYLIKAKAIAEEIN